MKLFVAFHHDGQDSQPMVGVGSSYEKALELIQAYDIHEDHINALYINHIFTESPEEYKEELEDEYGILRDTGQRAYFIEEVELDKLDETSYQIILIRADGSRIREDGDE